MEDSHYGPASESTDWETKEEHNISMHHNFQKEVKRKEVVNEWFFFFQIIEKVPKHLKLDNYKKTDFREDKRPFEVLHNKCSRTGTYCL